jgi:anti-sigma regulatory factor (Ser/Thr protein kinase)
MRTRSGFSHQALFYCGTDEFVTMTAGVVRSALAADEPVLAALPTAHLSLVRDALAADADQVRWVDMSRAGRNPGRILPGVLTPFQDEHRSRRVTMIGEPIWPGRTPGEYAAAVSHEALINLAFAGRAVTVVCPYDVAGLQPSALVDAERTHPELVDPDGSRDSELFGDPEAVAAQAARPIALPPPDASSFAVQSTDDLRAARVRVADAADLAGLPGDRRDRFGLACHEAMANALRHGGGRAHVTIWPERADLVCQVQSPGRFADPLAGRRAPSPTAAGGRGLVMINEICDLVQIWPSPDGLTIQMRISAD